MDPQALARLALLSAILAVSANGAPAHVPDSSSAQAGAQTYIVQSGDTLYSIAVKFGTTIAAIQQANNIADPNTLAVGQRLLIPGAVAQNAVTPQPTARGPTPSAPSTAQPAPTQVAAGQNPPSQEAETETYIVKAGDTLASIAAAFGVPLAELQRINNIVNPNLLNVGQRLIIPKVNAPAALPENISVNPPVVVQGKTITLRVPGNNVSEVLGKFDQQTLRFNRIDDQWVALAGISRCSNYIGAYPVNLTLRDNIGTPRTVQFTVRVNEGSFPTEDITLTAEMSALLDPAVQNAENALVSQTVAPYTPGQMWEGAFRAPVDVKNPRISALFGERRSYNGGKPGLCGHEGQDYAVPGGTPVYAPAAGVVVLAKPLQVRGNVVFIDHGRTVFSAFYHLDEIVAQDGQRVNAGDLIGKVGTTGFSTGDHLHWSMWVNGIYVDPVQWTEEEIP
jgi:murein DD-endopeptidase MepM/ murein hydrolase activator NlpD